MLFEAKKVFKMNQITVMATQITTHENKCKIFHLKPCTQVGLNLCKKFCPLYVSTRKILM